MGIMITLLANKAESEGIAIDVALCFVLGLGCPPHLADYVAGKLSAELTRRRVG